MNVAQKLSYWSRWQRCAAIFRAQGRTSAEIEEKRRAITEKALGYAKSMSAWKTWKNAEVDKVFAAFAAIYDGGNLDAQLDAIDQPDLRRSRVLSECLALAGSIKDQHPDAPDYDYVVWNYLNALARRICGKKAEECTDAQLHKLKGILQLQCNRLGRDLQKAEAQEANKDEPF